MLFMKRLFNIKTTYVKGREAEKRGKKYLQKNAWNILALNYKTKVGEIDIIALKHDILVAFEVKYREDLEMLPYSVSKNQRHRISKAILLFQKSNKNYSDKYVRFDVLLLSKDSIEHIENAW